MPLSPDVSLQSLARTTEQFSGADLQALMYNAHLEVVHSTLAHTDQPSTPSGDTSNEEEPVQYVQFGSSTITGVLTRAEESALQKRVRNLWDLAIISLIKRTIA